MITAMETTLRKLAGALAMELVFGIVWAAFGLAAVAVIGHYRPEDIDPGEGPLNAMRVIGGAGLVVGAACVSLLLLAERRRAFAGVPPWRAALWAMLAAAVFALLTEVDDRMVVILCPLAAVSAALGTALVRAAERRWLSPTGELALSGPRHRR